MRSKRSKIAILVLLLLAVSVGYAFLSTTLKIKGTTKVKSTTWNVYFDNIDVKEGSVVADEPELSENDTKVTFEVNLKKPGDKYEFTVDAVNEGSINAMIESVTKTSLTEAQAKYVNLTMTYEDGTEIQAKDLLASTKTETILISLEYKKNLSEGDLPQSDVPVDISLEIEYVQADNTAKEVEHPVSKGWVAITGDGTQVGDEIAIGDEHFYVISFDGTNINALAKYNLLVGNEVDTNSWVTTPLSNPTGKQDSTAIGIPVSGKKIGTLAFSNDKGWAINSDINIREYEGPLKEALYGENGYESYIKKTAPNATIRLITKSELEHLECSTSGYSCNSAPPWIYSTSYWTSSAKQYDYSVWAVMGDTFDGTDFNLASTAGVRPVVTIAFGSES